VTITGPGPKLLTIDARQQSRIFNITASQGDFVIKGLTLTNADGAIYSLADVSIDSSTISNNSGRGISVSCNAFGCPDFDSDNNKGRTVDVHHTTISGNHDGGIFAGSVTVSFSTIVGNSIETVVAPGAGQRWEFGGGIDASGDIAVINSIVAGNLLITYCDFSDSFYDAFSHTEASDLQSLSQSDYGNPQLGSVTV
jgi:hypothetical protein